MAFSELQAVSEGQEGGFAPLHVQSHDLYLISREQIFFFSSEDSFVGTHEHFLVTFLETKGRFEMFVRDSVV